VVDRPFHLMWILAGRNTLDLEITGKRLHLTCACSVPLCVCVLEYLDRGGDCQIVSRLVRLESGSNFRSPPSLGVEVMVGWLVFPETWFFGTSIDFSAEVATKLPQRPRP
jgi:hypothetical protein